VGKSRKAPVGAASGPESGDKVPAHVSVPEDAFLLGPRNNPAGLPFFQVLGKQIALTPREMMERVQRAKQIADGRSPLDPLDLPDYGPPAPPVEPKATEAQMRRFLSPFWTLKEALSWIAFGKPASIDAVKVWGAGVQIFLGELRDKLRQPDYEAELLAELQGGKIRASLDGRALRPEFWGDGNLWKERGAVFASEAIKLRWPAGTAVGKPAKPKPGPVPNAKLQGTVVALWKQGQRPKLQKVPREAGITYYQWKAYLRLLKEAGACSDDGRKLTRKTVMGAIDRARLAAEI